MVTAQVAIQYCRYTAWLFLFLIQLFTYDSNIQFGAKRTLYLTCTQPQLSYSRRVFCSPVLIFLPGIRQRLSEAVLAVQCNSAVALTLRSSGLRPPVGSCSYQRSVFTFINIAGSSLRYTVLQLSTERKLLKLNLKLVCPIPTLTQIILRGIENNYFLKCYISLPFTPIFVL